MGAWIEISITSSISPSLTSLLSWERGLKSKKIIIIINIHVSLLSWERGLKSEKHKDGAYHFQSLLSWERGLKSKLAVYLNISVIVAPLVGAWIEIMS